MLFHKLYGQGSQLFLGVHGWGASHRTFEHFEPHLHEHDASLLSLDLPGYGQSSEPERFDFPTINAPIRALIEAQDRPVHLIGSCSGTVHVLELALEIPEKIASIRLMEPFAYVPWYFRIFLAPGGQIAYYSTFANPLGRKITNLGLARQEYATDNPVDSFAIVPPHVPLRYLELYHRDGKHHRYKDIDLPIRCVTGALTFEAIRRSVEIWRGHWPQLQERVLPDVGHMIVQEATASTADMILRPSLQRAAEAA